ncbi:MAG: GNAT family N-acetyltransferase [Syntrophomonadaceae bacterium]|nr:GNAT family N-acetyltransferase [Syntrophomonadaceae bacterium]
MGFIDSYFYNIRLARVQDRREGLKIEKGKEYRGEKLTRVKNGDPLYLINCTSMEKNLGCIYAITHKRIDRCLKYLVVADQSKYIKIGDLRHEIIGQGIGTQLLIYLEEIARSEGANKITGWLSPVDLNHHRARLLHFYEKNGYQVTQGKMANMIIEGLIATKYI